MTTQNKVLTLTGVPLNELPARLDVEFPPDAYKEIPGASYLTDINPNYMRDLLNDVFGMCGYGWGYEYSPESFSLKQDSVQYSKGKKEMWFAQVYRLTFWYKLRMEDGEVERFEVPATGASDNKVAAYALKGALTAALGNAVSNIGFQKSVYMGQRSHKTVGRKKTAKKAAQKPAVAKSASKATKPQKKVTKKAAQPAQASDPADFVIPVGPKVGQKLADMNLKAITFYAKKMKVGGDPKKQALQQAAQALLAVRGNGHQPASVAA